MKKVKSLSRSLWHLKKKSLFKTPNIKLLSRRPDGCVIIVVDMVTSNLIATDYMVIDDPGSFYVFSVFLIMFLCILESKSCSVHAFSCICLVLVFDLVFLVN